MADIREEVSVVRKKKTDENKRRITEQDKTTITGEPLNKYRDKRYKFGVVCTNMHSEIYI